MKIQIVATLAVVASLSLTAAPKGEMPNKTGGLVMPPDNGKRILFVNACKARTNAFATLKAATSRLLYIPLKFVDTENPSGCPFKAAKSLRTEKTPAVVYVYAGENDGPILTVYMEDAIATINTTPLKSTTAKIEDDRLLKELYRGYGMVMGAYYSARMPSVLEPAYSLGQLDSTHINMFSPQHISAIMHGARQLDIPLLRPMPYQVACQRGWAPQPTNEYQKAIWDKVHAIPKNPLKIEFDPKKGR